MAGYCLTSRMSRGGRRVFRIWLISAFESLRPTTMKEDILSLKSPKSETLVFPR